MVKQIKLSEPFIEKAEIDAVNKVLMSGRLVQGPLVKELEKDFSLLCGIKYAIATNNGTSALHTALHSLGIGKGDEVITTPFTFVATANAILMVGAKPIFVDIDEETFNIDSELIGRKITKDTKAILAVDLFGQPADYKKINQIAKKYGLFVVEDAAQSIGATYFNKKTGNLADIGTFSLYATKNITSGEGGMITTNNKNYYEKSKLFRSHGQDENDRYSYLGLGYNYRMTDIAAAIALQQLKKIDFLTRKRKQIAGIYNSELKDIKGLITPKVKTGIESVYHQYAIRITPEFKLTREKFRDYLHEKGIETYIYYPKGLYSFDHLRFGNEKENFPVTERITKEVLSIPVNPKLKNEDVYYIINVIKNL